MTASKPVLPLAQAATKTTNHSSLARWFYPMTALVLFGITIAGFHQFYFHGRAVGGRQIPARILLLVVAHGVAMTFWVLLFVLQPFLIVSGCRRCHMMLGRVGVLLATAIVVLGILVAIESARIHPEGRLWGLSQKQFMAVPLASIIKFSIFVSMGVWMRYRPESHRAMMLLATLSVVQPASARISWLTAPYRESIWAYLVGPALPILILGACFLLGRCVLLRRLDRAYAWGYGVLLVTSPLVMVLARSALWERMATLLVG